MKEAILLTAMIFIGVSTVFAQSVQNEFRAYGIKINVPDLEKAVEFYSGVLGFKIQRADFDLREIHLLSGDKRKIIIRETQEKLFPNDGETSCASIALRVNNLDETFKKLTAKGVKFIDTAKRPEGIGFSMHIYDVFGNLISLDEITVGERQTVEEPKLYNFGIYIPDIEKAMNFYADKIGFVERTKQYLPEDMPLYHADKSFGFMLHLNREKWGLRKEIKGKNAVNLIFAVKDVAETQKHLKKLGLNTTAPTRSIEGKFISFEDSFGLRVDAIEID